MASQYLNQFDTKEEMNSAYASGHSDEWVAYCAEDNNIYYNTNLTGNSKYFDDLEYNSENKTLDFYIDDCVKKSIDVSPWWFEKDSYYTREEVNNKLNNLTLPYSSITSTPTTLSGYGITNAVKRITNQINQTYPAIIVDYSPIYSSCVKIGTIERYDGRGNFVIDFTYEENDGHKGLCGTAKLISTWDYDVNYSGLTCHQVYSNIQNLNKVFLVQETNFSYGIYFRIPNHTSMSLLIYGSCCNIDIFSEPIKANESDLTIAYEFTDKLKLDILTY